jgi:hypothetical protein
MASRLFHAIVLMGAQMACNRDSLPNQARDLAAPDLAVVDSASVDLCSCAACPNPISDCTNPGVTKFCSACSCFPCFI